MQKQNSAGRTLTGDAKSELWTHLYAPAKFEECVGNRERRIEIAEWLRDWDEVFNKKTKAFPVVKRQIWGQGGWPTKVDPNRKAMLISGPPGIGKTTAVRLISQTLGFNLVERNASDVRSKNSILYSLGVITANNSLLSADRHRDVSTKNKNNVILMDECDGVSAGDRGGIQQLIQLIKTTTCPIICIVNDRAHQKVKSLATYCYDVEFKKPSKQEIIARAQHILQRERISFAAPQLDQVCEMLDNDLRQIINFLQISTHRSKTLSAGDLRQSLGKKDQQVMMTHFEAAKSLMTRAVFQKLSLHQRRDLFFVDHEWVPLIVQNQYLESIPRE